MGHSQSAGILEAIFGAKLFIYHSLYYLMSQLTAYAQTYGKGELLRSELSAKEGRERIQVM